MNRGVWRYTRHPNYFGDAAQWWGYWLIALAAGGWWTIFSPILMTTLLVRVSGVALLEKTMETRPVTKSTSKQQAPLCHGSHAIENNGTRVNTDFLSIRVHLCHSLSQHCIGAA